MEDRIREELKNAVALYKDEKEPEPLDFLNQRAKIPCVVEKGIFQKTYRIVFIDKKKCSEGNDRDRCRWL